MVFSPDEFEFSDSPEPVQIRASTVLPAKRENIELVTTDGLRLLGELAAPASGAPAATLVTFHPLPTHGGFMDSHVFRKASYRLPALAGIAVLRFNTRGTCSPRGCSEGVFGEGIGERHDVEAAVRWVAERNLPNPWLVGWSFGTELVLKYGAVDPVQSLVNGGILLSPPLHRAGEADLDAWRESGKPLKVLVPEHDDYLRPVEARERFARVPQADVIGVEGAKHLWVGEKYAGRVLNEITETVLGGTGSRVPPLPAEWSGPVATSSLA